MLLALGCATPGARAGGATAEAREIFARAEKTVVTVKAVLKISMSGHDSEQKLEVTGTVIDPSGLTVVPASALDPGATVRAISRGGQTFKVETTVTETQIVLADGTELEADVILKDAELDFAFLRPRGWDAKDARPLDAVALKPGHGLPQLLDELVMVGRYGRSANRTAWLELARVRAIVRGPRPYAICSDVSGDTPGTVAYAADGTPLGVFVTHISRDSGDSLRSGRGGGAIILRAVEDVLEVADQARKLPNPPHKAEEPVEPTTAPPGPAAPAPGQPH